MSEHDKKAHSTFGGSSADRWMNCAGSTALCATVPPRPSTSYAAEGTAAHALAEHALTHDDRSVQQWVGDRFDYEDHGETKTIAVAKAMADAVDVYLDAVYQELALAPDAELYVEQRFTLDIKTAEPGEVFGSNDALVYIPSLKKLTVFDYKHGFKEVSAEDNAQLKFYASGAALSHTDWPVAQVDLVIVQPLGKDAEENDGGVKRWTMDPLDLLDFIGEAEEAIDRAQQQIGYQNNGLALELNPSPTREGWCKWCDAAAICPAREQKALQASTLDFKDITLVTPRSLPEVKDMDVARLGQVLVAIEMLEDWGKQVHSHVESLVQQGVPVPDPRGGFFKMVEKIGRRKWIDDEEKIAGFMSVMYGVDEDDSRPRKLVTITEAERLIKARVTDKIERKNALDEVSLAFTLKESSGLTMVPASDKREAVDAVARDFGSVIL